MAPDQKPISNVAMKEAMINGHKVFLRDENPEPSKKENDWRELGTNRITVITS